MTRRINILMTLALVFATSMVFAQSASSQLPEWAEQHLNSTSASFKKKKDGKKSNGKVYPDRPKDAWEIGLGFGHFMTHGDVYVRPGWAVSGHLRKSFGYTFSVRGQLVYGNAFGLDDRPADIYTSGIGLTKAELNTMGYVQNGQWGGSNALGNGSKYYRNYKARHLHAALHGVVNLNNILFHKERNKVEIHAFAGPSIYTFNVFSDLKDGDNVREWDPLSSDNQGGGLFSNQIIKELKNDYLDDYETEVYVADGQFNIGQANGNGGTNIGVANPLNIGNASTPIFPGLEVGAGISFKLTRRINLAIEEQITITGNDFLDGHHPYKLNNNNIDIPHYTSVRLNFNLMTKKRDTEPLWWVNPLDYPYNELAKLKGRKSAEELLSADEDEDGVPDIMDKEPNTPKDCPVNIQGIALDSDGDGILDCKDKEPYSPNCGTINSEGVAECPTGLTESDVHRIVDPLLNRPVDCSDCKVGSSACGPVFFPVIHFDLDKYGIKPEYYPQLRFVADALQQCPELCIEVYGNTDARNSNDYNRVLSYNRAKEVKDYLVRKYGISPSRLIIKYAGEEDLSVPNASKESAHFMNRRVEFRKGNCGEGDMARPEGPNAGSRDYDFNGSKVYGKN